MSKALQEAKMLRELGLIRPETLQKIAEARADVLEKFGSMPGKADVVLGTLLTGAVGAGLLGGGKLVSILLDKAKLSRSKREMYLIDPTLSEVPAEEVNRAFDLLSHFAPSVAKNPISAANFVKSLTLMPTIGDPATVQNLVNIEKGKGLSQFGGGFAEQLGKNLASDIMRGAHHMANVPTRDE